MARACEICSELGKTAQGKLHHVIVEDRMLELCGDHTRVVKASGADTIESVRALFREVTGKRSALPRRMELDRRAFPARPEGRRLASGRRSTDF